MHALQVLDAAKLIHMTKNIYPQLIQQIESIDTTNIPEQRRETLAPLVAFIQTKVNNGEQIRLNFICTHNSRRSHLSQVWAQVMASYFKISNVYSYSGGTENTALFPVVAKTLVNTGFQIETLSEGNNPVYSIKYDTNSAPIIGFSKTFDNPFNPQSGFAAILTCSSADEGCPFIAGAEKRIPITFEDPKAFDESPLQLEKYNERSIQIATELYFVFSQLKK